MVAVVVIVVGGVVRQALVLAACIEEESCAVEGKALDSTKEERNMAGVEGVGGVGGVVLREDTSSSDPITSHQSKFVKTSTTTYCIYGRGHSRVGLILRVARLLWLYEEVSVIVVELIRCCLREKFKRLFNKGC